MSKPKILVVSRDLSSAGKLISFLSPDAIVDFSHEPKPGDWDIIYAGDLTVVQEIKKTYPTIPVLLMSHTKPSLEDLRNAWSAGALGVIDVSSASPSLNKDGNGKVPEILFLEIYNSIRSLDQRVGTIERDLVELKVTSSYLKEGLQEVSQRIEKSNGKRGLDLSWLGSLFRGLIHKAP
jgi:hypothetical protein